MFDQVFIVSPITLRVEFLASLSAVRLKEIYNGYKNIAERQMLFFIPCCEIGRNIPILQLRSGNRDNLGIIFNIFP